MELSPHNLLQGCYTDWFSTIKIFYTFYSTYSMQLTLWHAHPSPHAACKTLQMLLHSLFSFPSQNTRNPEPTRQTEQLCQQVPLLLLWSNDLGQSQTKYLLAHSYKIFHFFKVITSCWRKRKIKGVNKPTNVKWMSGILMLDLTDAFFLQCKPQSLIFNTCMNL